MADQETTASEANREPEPESTAAAPTTPPAPPTAPASPPQAYEADPRYALPASPRPPQARMPFLAALCSLFPGLGNIYNGLYLRGITFFVICFGLIGIGSASDTEERVILVFSVIFVWLFNIFDAYRQATLINYGYTPDVELSPKPRIAAWGSGGLTLGVVVFLIGFYFFLHNRFGFDLSVVFDNADILIMAFGAFLIGSWAREWWKSKAASEDKTDLEGF